MELVKLMEAFNKPIRQFIKADFGTKTELVQMFCDCCSASGKHTVTPSSPLALGFFSFMAGVEYGRSGTNGQEEL
ncbi:hypothetical protein [uncultured Neglectibacter sp.]|uniref:hypothetical protein n=1 Tax=uncultured Neglectibacter sp. TaxID=1924108 RepID=UPI0034DF21AD